MRLKSFSLLNAPSMRQHRAAEHGQSEAQFEVGVMHRDGLGTPIDGMQALNWFERAAERGAPHAFNAIGEMYLGHRDVAQD